MRPGDIVIITAFFFTGLFCCGLGLFHAGPPILVFSACWLFVTVNPVDLKRGLLSTHSTFLAQLQPCGKRAKSAKHELVKAESPAKRGRSKNLSVVVEANEDVDDDDEDEAVEICLGASCKRKNDLLQLECGHKFCRNCLDDLHWADKGMNKCPRCKTELYELPEEEPSWLAKAPACALLLLAMAHGWTLFDTIVLSKSVDRSHLVHAALILIVFCAEIIAVTGLAKAMRNHGNQWPSKWLQPLCECDPWVIFLVGILAIGAFAVFYQPSLPLDAGVGGFVEVALEELSDGLAWARSGTTAREIPMVEPEPEPEPEPATGWRAFFNWATNVGR